VGYNKIKTSRKHNTFLKKRHSDNTRDLMNSAGPHTTFSSMLYMWCIKRSITGTLGHKQPALYQLLFLCSIKLQWKHVKSCY